MIQCTGLPIATTIAGQWSNSLIFHDNIKCITANGLTIINVRTDYVCHVTIIPFAQNFFGKHGVIPNTVHMLMVLCSVI